MSATEDDDAEANTITVADSQISAICAATRKVLEVSGGNEVGVKEALNQLNQKWLEAMNAPPHVTKVIEERCTYSVAPQQRKRKATEDITNQQSNAASEKEDEEEDDEEDDEGEDARMEDDNAINGESATSTQMETFLAARTKMQTLRDDDQYKSKYAIARLPSMMAMTEGIMDWIFSDDSSGPVDVTIRTWIKDMLETHHLGMIKALMFRQSVGGKEWNPIWCSTVSAMAKNLDDSTTNATENSGEYSDVRYAIEYEKTSGDFPLPANSGINALAKHFLTVNETMRSHLSVLLNGSAGCSAFLALEMSDLLEGFKKGDSPILSAKVLSVLGYDDDSVPDSMNQLLKRFKASFDDKSISTSDKVVLQAAFSSIGSKACKLDLAKWEAIDSTELGFSTVSLDEEAAAPSHYFASSQEKVGKARRSRAIYTLTGMVVSSFIHQQTRDSVEYGSYDGYAPVMYRNSLDYSFRMGMKLTMTKTFNGNADEKYMASVHDNLGSLVAKADSGSGRGGGRSKYSDDVSILVKLSSDRKIDKILQRLGFDPEEAGIEYSDDDTCNDGDGDDDDDEVAEGLGGAEEGDNGNYHPALRARMMIGAAGCVAASDEEDDDMAVVWV